MSNRTLKRVHEVSLLPVSAAPTPYELAMEHAAQLEANAWEAAERVGDVRIDVPDEAVPFLVWEYGLEPVLPYVPDLRKALSEGRMWQDERGTDAGIMRALSWIDVTPDKIEQHPDDAWWDMFQLALGAPVSREEYERIVALTRLSKEAHADIIRIYAGWDERSFDWNRSAFNGPDLFNDWSGLWIDPALPKLSFGRSLLSIPQGESFGSNAIGLRSKSRMYFGDEDDGFTFNRDDINGDRIINIAGRGGVALRDVMRGLSAAQMVELGAWPLAPWQEGATWQAGTVQAVGLRSTGGSVPYPAGKLGLAQLAPLGPWPLTPWNEHTTWEVATVGVVARKDSEGI